MRIAVVWFAFFCLILGCKDLEYPQTFPIVLTEDVTNINSDGAEFVGIVESLGTSHNVIRYGFVWDESEMPTLNSSYLSIADDIQKGNFSKTIKNDLVAGNEYYVRAFIQTDKLVVYGNSVTFTSQGSLPIYGD